MYVDVGSDIVSGLVPTCEGEASRHVGRQRSSCLGYAILGCRNRLMATYADSMQHRST